MKTDSSLLESNPVGLVGRPQVVPAVPVGGTGTISISPVPPATRQVPPPKIKKNAVPPKPAFALTLQAVPGWGDVPAINRLRRFLKAALRSYGLRCVRCEPSEPEPGGRVASDLIDPPAAPGELLTYRPASWELP